MLARTAWKRSARRQTQVFLRGLIHHEIIWSTPYPQDTRMPTDRYVGSFTNMTADLKPKHRPTKKMKMDSCKLKELMSINIDPSGLYAKGYFYGMHTCWTSVPLYKTNKHWFGLWIWLLMQFYCRSFLPIIMGFFVKNGCISKSSPIGSLPFKDPAIPLEAPLGSSAAATPLRYASCQWNKHWWHRCSSPRWVLRPFFRTAHTHTFLGILGLNWFKMHGKIRMAWYRMANFKSWIIDLWAYDSTQAQGTWWHRTITTSRIMIIIMIIIIIIAIMTTFLPFLGRIFSPRCHVALL